MIGSDLELLARWTERQDIYEMVEYEEERWRRIEEMEEADWAETDRRV